MGFAYRNSHFSVPCRVGSIKNHQKTIFGGSWEGLGRVLGFLWVALGAQDRFFSDLGSILRSVLGAKTDQNLSKSDAEMHSNCASVFGSIFDRFLIDFEVHFAINLGPCWAASGGSATQQKTLKNKLFLMVFEGSGVGIGMIFLCFWGVSCEIVFCSSGERFWR